METHIIVFVDIAVECIGVACTGHRFISTIAYRVLWALYRENENITDGVSAVDYDK